VVAAHRIHRDREREGQSKLSMRPSPHSEGLNDLNDLPTAILPASLAQPMTELELTTVGARLHRRGKFQTVVGTTTVATGS